MSQSQFPTTCDRQKFAGLRPSKMGFPVDVSKTTKAGRKESESVGAQTVMAVYWLVGTYCWSVEMPVLFIGRF